jgi:resolvase-like protein
MFIKLVLLEEMERWGCEVEFLDHPMGRDPHDQLLLQIRGAVAEYERTLMARRACAGVARGSCARVGCCLGRGRLTATAPILTGPGTRPGCAWSPPRRQSSPSSLPVIASRA